MLSYRFSRSTAIYRNAFGNLPTCFMATGHLPLGAKCANSPCLNLGGSVQFYLMMVSSTRDSDRTTEKPH